MTNWLNIKDITTGMLFWECEGGQDALFLAIEVGPEYTPDRRYRIGRFVNAIGIPDGKPQRFFEHRDAGGYGLRLYSEPQYTRPALMPLLAGLVAVYQQQLTEVQGARQAETSALRNEVINATKETYRALRSERSAQVTINRLHDLIQDLENIARNNLNGITMGNRIVHAIREYRDEVSAAHAGQPDASQSGN